VPTPEEQALHDAILANLRRSTPARAEEDEELRAVRAALFCSTPTAPPRGRDLPPPPARRPGQFPPRPTGDDEIVRALLPPTRRATGPDWRSARTYARDWRTFGATAEEVRTWLRAGAAPEDGPLVAFLMDEGIGPARLMEQVEHPETGEQVTILDIARAVLGTFGTSADDLSKALDKAAVERTRLRTTVFRRRPTG
jgi:hypothetical protein